MKYNVQKLVEDETSLLSHIFMNEIGNTKWFKGMQKRREKMSDEEINAETVDIKLTVNGEQLPIKATFEHIEGQWDRMVKEEATKLVKEQTSDKVTEIANQLHDIKEKIEYMAEDINWDYEHNPLTHNKQN